MTERAVPRGPCSPAGSIGEYNIAVLISALQEGDTGVLLPVPHGLPEDCPLAACQEEGGCHSVQVSPPSPTARVDTRQAEGTSRITVRSRAAGT